MKQRNNNSILQILILEIQFYPSNIHQIQITHTLWNNFSQLDWYTRYSPIATPFREEPSWRGPSSLVPSELLAFLAFLKVHERAHSNTIQRSWLEPGSRGRCQEIRTLQRGSWFTTRAFLLLFQAELQILLPLFPPRFHLRVEIKSSPPLPFEKFRTQSHTFCLYIFSFVSSRSCFANNPFGQPPPSVGRRPTCSTLITVPLGHWSRRRVALPATTFSRQSLETSNPGSLRDGKEKQVLFIPFFF